MIEMPVVSVLREGIVENIKIWAEHPSHTGLGVEVRGAPVGDDVVQQLKLARDIAQTFLGRPYVKPLVEDDLEESTIIVEFPGDQAYEGPSFGLAFLAGCLAVGLGVPIRKGRLFTAALAGKLEIPGMPGGAVYTESVGEIGAKLAAACKQRQSRLYLRSDDERTIMEFEQAFWRGEASRSCLPYLLPEYFSTAAVVAMALEPEELLEKVISVDGAAAFMLLMFATGAQLPSEASLLAGIGTAIAHLRRDGKLSDVNSLEELAGELGIKGICTPDHLLLLSFGECVKACMTDEMREQVIKALISSDPYRPMFTDPTSNTGGLSDLTQTNFDIWLDRQGFGDFREYISSLQVLRLCSQLAPDFEGYWPRVKQFVLGGLVSCLDQAVQLVESSREKQAANLLYAFLTCNIGASIGQLNPAFVGEAIGIIGSSLTQLGNAADPNIFALARALEADLTRYRLPEALMAIEEQQDPALTLTFQLIQPLYPNVGAEVPTFQPRPPLAEYNDLELIISGPKNLALRVPSPVLLFEGCRQQLSGYCRRGNMTLADDTMSRYPENDAQVAMYLFYESNCNVIGFRMQSGNKTDVASVRWLASVNPWPPAIDSQFLAASIASDKRNIEPRRLADIGCGTGYLAIVAAHRWSSLEELHIVDIDALAIAAASVNLGADTVTSKLNVTTHASGFKRFSEQGFDVLICSPPYLPGRPLPGSHIEVSTNGTALLEEVVTLGSHLSREVWLAFSVLAWPEFQRALAQVPDAYSRIEILRREMVPFRIGWLEPVPPDDEHTEFDFAERCKYYDNVLLKRGLIDMDGNDNWPEHIKYFYPKLPAGCTSDLKVGRTDEELEAILDLLKADSRGYRFWHEVRVVRLISAEH